MMTQMVFQNLRQLQFPCASGEVLKKLIWIVVVKLSVPRKKDPFPSFFFFFSTLR